MARKLYETFAYVNIVLCAMGIFINLVFIHALRKLKKQKIGSFRFFLCLSISDCSFCAVEIVRQWLIGHRQLRPTLLSSILLAILGFCWIFSPVIMLLIVCDRLIHMKYLLQYPSIMTKRRSYIMLMIAIAIALQFSILFILSFLLSSKHWSKLMIYHKVVVSLLLVLSSVIVIVYSWTYIMVKKRVADLTSIQPSSGQGNVSNANNTEQDRAENPVTRTTRA